MLLQKKPRLLLQPEFGESKLPRSVRLECRHRITANAASNAQTSNLASHKPRRRRTHSRNAAHRQRSAVNSVWTTSKAGSRLKYANLETSVCDFARGRRLFAEWHRRRALISRAKTDLR